MIALRMEILRKPLELSFVPEDLAKEANDILIGVYDEDRLVACCILTKHTEDTCKLRQMAVHPKMQKNGVGVALMHFAENLARDNGYKNMVMNSRKTAIGFYEKLGFSVCSDEFVEVTIPHFQMSKKLI
jgi:predicted GNAT family N-acyltransferase